MPCGGRNWARGREGGVKVGIARLTIKWKKILTTTWEKTATLLYKRPLTFYALWYKKISP